MDFGSIARLLLRQALLVGGTMLVARGVPGAEAIAGGADQIAGTVLALGGAAWQWRKFGQRKDAEAVVAAVVAP